MSNPIKYKGKTFRSLSALVRAHAAEGISPAAVTSRIKAGWDLEAALSKPAARCRIRQFKVDDQVFDSLKALADAAGITYAAAVKRRHRGGSDQEVFHGRPKQVSTATSNPKAPDRRGIPVSVLGKVYENQRMAFDAHKPKCSFNTFRGRLSLGWSIEEALEVVPKVDGRKANSRSRLIAIDRVSMSVTQASKKFGFPLATITDRLDRGATPEQAVGLVAIGRGTLLTQAEAYQNRAKRTPTCYLVNGKSYQSVAELAMAFDLPRPLVYNRMKINGWTAERAVTEPLYDEVEVGGQSFKSALNAWEAIGETNFSTFQARRSNGLPLDVCLGLNPLPSQDRYEINGQSFSSLADVAEAYGLTQSQLSSRLRNMNLEEAVEYNPSNGRFSEAVFERDESLAQSPGILYFVKIELVDGALHKIGITQRSVAARFQSYKVVVLREFSGALVDAYRLEQLVKTEFQALHYRAEEEFEGRTETFLLMEDEEQAMLDFLEEKCAEFRLQ